MTCHASFPAASAMLATRTRRGLAALALTAQLGVPGLALALDAAPAEIEVGNHPARVVTGRDGGRAFVTKVNDGTPSVIDTASNEVVATPAVGAGPNGVTYLEH